MMMMIQFDAKLRYMNRIVFNIYLFRTRPQMWDKLGYEAKMAKENILNLDFPWEKKQKTIIVTAKTITLRLFGLYLKDNI